MAVGDVADIIIGISLDKLLSINYNNNDAVRNRILWMILSHCQSLPSLVLFRCCCCSNTMVIGSIGKCCAESWFWCLSERIEKETAKLTIISHFRNSSQINVHHQLAKLMSRIDFPDHSGQGLQTPSRAEGLDYSIFVLKLSNPLEYLIINMHRRASLPFMHPQSYSEYSCLHNGRCSTTLQQFLSARRQLIFVVPRMNRKEEMRLSLKCKQSTQTRSRDEMSYCLRPVVPPP